MVQVVKSIAHRADAHGRAVAPTVVRSGIRVICPSVKTAAVSGSGVPVVEASQILGVGGAGQDAVRQGHGQDGVVGEMGIMGKEMEILGLDVLPFVHRSDNVSGYGSDHGVPPNLVGVCSSLEGRFPPAAQAYSKSNGLVLGRNPPDPQAGFRGGGVAVREIFSRFHNLTILRFTIQTELHREPRIRPRAHGAGQRCAGR